MATEQSIACELDRNFGGSTYRYIPQTTLDRANATVILTVRGVGYRFEGASA